MLNQTQTNFKKIKDLLLRRKKEVESDIKALSKDDPVLDIASAESSEPGTDSWMADVHARAVSTKQNLYDILSKTKKALLALKSGKYGKCEKCGKAIEAKRLEVMPSAILCISCSKKKK